MKMKMIFNDIHSIFFADYDQSDNLSTQMERPNVKNEDSAVSEELLSGMIINERFEIGDFLGGGYTGFVRNGMWNTFAFLPWNFSLMFLFSIEFSNNTQVRIWTLENR